uniref:Nitric oxide synthase-interacting protein homolog n=1 Tax=Caligus rogercresseyi TaxID=217165 RepID=C1BMJ9_CALRO|nr:Nitric oxide synthase-interacting protein [Caligus rogercresseyi]
MTRHGRNATNSAVYTYLERKKDASASGYGTERCRLGKDSLKGFDCCSLMLQPCSNPVVTPAGWLFDKQPILEYILAKKKEYNKKLKEYQRQKDRESKESEELAEAEKESRLRKFQSSETSILTKNNEPSTSYASSSSSKRGESSKLPSFWVPNNTPQASKTKINKPDKTVYCPMSRSPLRLKDLVDVKFKLLNPDEKHLISKTDRYVCAVTGDVLHNSSPCAVLKTTGDVVTVECVNKIIKKDMVHPLSGQTLKESDIIYLQRGGTGYAASNSQLEASHYRPSLGIA